MFKHIVAGLKSGFTPEKRKKRKRKSGKPPNNEKNMYIIHSKAKVQLQNNLGYLRYTTQFFPSNFDLYYVLRVYELLSQKLGNMNVSGIRTN